ncbi:hypothetical protein ZOSMA_56G01140 [Zostera marina]|uniref:Uncharacterized protein n=1 Tax=Zostera marina TaxID=29655 RepID=A0A0K9NW60_ZOSMR|nr:hypothetical protein ZOSMA_56G01140 [Zostera marina]
MGHHDPHHHHHHGGNPIMACLCCPCAVFSSAILGVGACITAICSPFLRCFGFGDHHHNHHHHHGHFR